MALALILQRLDIQALTFDEQSLISMCEAEFLDPL